MSDKHSRKIFVNLAVHDLKKSMRDIARRGATEVGKRGVSGMKVKMTPDLARRILELHAATGMTQQEIAFELGVNQGRVNEVIKRGKWLTGDPNAPEAVTRDQALARARGGKGTPRRTRPAARSRPGRPTGEKGEHHRRDQAQLTLGDL